MPQVLGEKRPVRRLYAAAALLLFLYYLLWPLNFYLARSLYATVFPPALGLMLLGCFVLLPAWRSRAALSLLLYLLWLYVSRALCGDPLLRQELHPMLSMSACFVVLPAPLLLDGADRRRFFTALALCWRLFMLLLGLAALTALLRDRTLVNPITEGHLASLGHYVEGRRLSLLDQNPNISAMWAYLAFCLSLGLMARCRGRGRLLRLPLGLMAALDYACIALTQSRNVKLVFSASLVLLALLWLRPRLRTWKKPLAAAVLAASLLLLPLGFMSFSLTNAALGRLSGAAASVTEASAAAASDGERAAGFGDERAWNEDSGRLPIYRSALTSFQREPLRLLRGCLSKDVMRIANQVLPRPKVHLHCSYLQVLMETGLPGFLLMAVFCLLLLRRMAALLCAEGAPLWLRLCALPLAGSLLYDLLEVNLFIDADARSLSFFLLAGLVLATRE